MDAAWPSIARWQTTCCIIEPWVSRSVVDVLVASKASINRLAKQSDQLVDAIGSDSMLCKRGAREIGQPDRIIQLLNEQQTTIRTELRPPDLQPHTPGQIQASDRPKIPHPMGEPLNLAIMSSNQLKCMRNPAEL